MAALIRFVKTRHWEWQPLAALVIVALVLASITPLGNTMWAEGLISEGSVTTGSWIPTPTPAGQSGTTLSAEKSAEGFREGEMAGVRGEICVSNGGERGTETLTIVDQVQYKVSGKKGGGANQYQDLPGATTTLIPDTQLGPGESRCYSYEILFAPVPEANYRNVARVTITNHSGWLPGGQHCPGPEPCPFGPEPKVDFEIPESPPALLMMATETPTPTPTETAVPLDMNATPTLVEATANSEASPFADTIETPTPTPIVVEPIPDTATPELPTLEPPTPEPPTPPPDTPVPPPETPPDTPAP